MFHKEYDVIICSAFGKGHWLAAELCREKLRVLLIDLSSQLGNWPIEDQIGPFGFFRLERFTPTFVERWNHDNVIEMMPHGWTWWLPQGPLEMKGPLTEYHLHQAGFSTHLDHLPISGPFQKNWLSALSYQVASAVYQPSARAHEGGRPLPLSAPFGVSQGTRQGFARNIEWLKSLGVHVAEKSKVIDLSFGGRKKISGLEISGEISGMVRAHQIVWGLTGAETEGLSDKLSRYLYPHGVTEPSWCWMRYRLKVEDSPEVQVLPRHSVWISQLAAPWTHENLLIVQKTAVTESLDAWVRLPAVQRFNRDYLEEHGRRLLSVMQQRMPVCRPLMGSLPQEAMYTSEEMGQPRFPVWDTAQRPQAGRAHMNGFYFESSEDLENYSVDCEFDRYQALALKIVQKWKLKMAKEPEVNS